MNEVLNDLMYLESAVLRFKSHYTEHYVPFRGHTIPMPEARRVRLAIQEILSVDTHLRDALAACAPEPVVDQPQGPTCVDELRMLEQLRIWENEDERVEYRVVHRCADEPELGVCGVLIVVFAVLYFAWPWLHGLLRGR